MFRFLKSLWANQQPCQLSGRVTGLGDQATLVFARPDFACDVDLMDGYYSASLRPGHYWVGYRIFGNFMRHICDIEVSQCGEFNFHYDTPKMTVKIENLPVNTHGGMVYFRNTSGSGSGQTVEQFAEFELDFLRDPDFFLDSYEQLAILVGDWEHRFPFKVAIGTTVNLDFSQSQKFRQSADDKVGLLFRYMQDDEFSLLDLIARFNFKTIGSVSFLLGKPGNELNFADGKSCDLGSNGVFNTLGCVDIHFPCCDHIKVRVRAFLPPEYHEYDRMHEFIKQLFAALSIPADETFEARFVTPEYQELIEQRVNRDGITDGT